MTKSEMCILAVLMIVFIGAIVVIVTRLVPQREPSVDLSIEQCRSLCAPAPVEGLSATSCQCFHNYFEGRDR